MSMFNFFTMADNYDQRKVGRHDAEWGFVSTCYVNDAEQPYETAVKHDDYNDGKIVIVETYDTKDEAESGHERWVQTMAADVLPECLVDRGSSGVSQLVDVFAPEGEGWRTFERKETKRD